MRVCCIMMVVAMAGASTACQKSQPQPQAQDQNISIDEPMTNETLANADIETLPPDESSATPSNELATGSDNPDVNDVSANSH